MRTSARNVEADRIGSRIGVRVDDGLPQRSGTGVVRVGDDESRPCRFRKLGPEAVVAAGV